jgi:SecD/SecF fusion protein
MQNRGAIKLIAIALTLVCIYQLSFTYVTKRVERAAARYADDKVKQIEEPKAKEEARKKKEFYYLDSIASEKVYNFFWLRKYTYRECKEREINLGLDLKGGMNVTLEVSVVEIVRSMSNYSTDSSFLAAIDMAKKMPATEDFISRFGKAYQLVAPNQRLAPIFMTPELREQINFNSTNEEVLALIHKEAEGAIANSFNILRSRIDRFGVSQPNIQRLEGSGRILVELPGIKEPERVRKLLQGTANLEFWETYDNTEIFKSLEAANLKVKEIRDAKLALEQGSTTTAPETKVEKDTISAGGENELIEMLKDKADTSAVAKTDIAKDFPLFALLQPSLNNQGQPLQGPMVGMAHSRDTALVNEYLKLPQVKTLFPRDLRLLWGVKSPRWDKTETYFELIAIRVSNSDGRAPLDGGAITDAREEFSQTGGNAEVTMAMNAEGAKVWAQLTNNNINRSIAIVLDNYVYSYPNVKQKIEGGRSSISGDFTINEAKDLANVLKSGKLPAPARIVQEEIVGPSLGQAAIDSGIRSFIFSFIVVLVFMLLYYSQRAGLIADVALMANLFFIFGVLASFQATLTLPGIAGIVLTMGMAVDANVLIFERIREELRGGKGLALAVADGYKNAFSAIIDGNVTTLLTAVILYVFGSGPIRGFATTLVIGILTSLFCALFLSRIIIHYMLDKKYKLTFSTSLSEKAFSKVKFDFIKSRKVAYVISAIFLLFSIGSLITRGLNPGIDFVGGRSYVVKFVNQEAVSTVEIGAALRNQFGEAPEVKTFGDPNQVKITTKYKINEDGENIDNEVDSLIHKGLVSFLPENTDMSTFRNDYKQSSIKVGPTIAADIKQEAFIAVFLALIAIFLYILIRFKNWRYGTGAVIALFHDTLIVIGVFSLLFNRVPFSLEIDQAFIAAILTIIGYSINDTVIIFDRIREYVGLYPKRDRKDTINSALVDTLSRTFATSFSTLVVLIPIFFFGGEVIRGFIFGLIIGILVGTYSSLFVASPIAYDLERHHTKKGH